MKYDSTRVIWPASSDIEKRWGDPLPVKYYDSKKIFLFSSKHKKREVCVSIWGGLPTDPLGYALGWTLGYDQRVVNIISENVNIIQKLYERGSSIP